MKKKKAKLSICEAVDKEIKSTVKNNFEYLFDELHYSVDSYLEDLSDEEVLAFTLDKERLSAQIINSALKAFNSEETLKYLQKEAKETTTDAERFLKDIKQHVVDENKRKQAEALNSKANKDKKAKLLKSLTAEQKKLVAEVYGK